MRTVKPRTAPTTLAELVLDLDDRSDGDEAGDLLIPAEEWRVLLDRAQVEVERRDFSEELAAPTPPEKKAPPVGGLCHGFADCCRKLTKTQLERGDTQCARCRAARLAIDAGEATSAYDYDAKKAAAKAAKKPKQQKGWKCDGCGYQHQRHPSRCADCGKVYPGDLDGDGLPVEDAPAPAVSREQAMSMRMSDKTRQRAAAKARKEGSVIMCHRCAATISEDTGGLGQEKEGQRGWTLADGTYCFTCAAFVRANAPELPLDMPPEKPKRRRMPIVDEPPVAAPEVTT